MNTLFKQTISSDLGRLEELTMAVCEFLGSHGVDAQASYRINLALEEMITNIIKYGYDDSGPHEIRVALEVLETEVVAVIEDDGHEFNPLLRPEIEAVVPLEERKIGGLGIHLVRKLLDHVDYQRREGVNVLEIRARRTL